MRRFMLAAASVAALACLGACSDDRNVTQDAAAAEATPSAESTPQDPYAWTDVPYKEYLDAAQQIDLRPDVLVPEADFSAGLDKLCHTTPDEFAAMRKSQMTNTQDTDTYTTAKYLGDEVGLRIGLACPQRMGDWAATSADHADDDSADDDNSEVTDADLARAEAEEAAASSKPDYDHGDYSSPSASPDTNSSDSSDSTDSSDHSTSSSSDDGEVSTTSTGGVTTGNGTPQR